MSCLLVLARAQHGALPCRGVLALDCVVSAALAAREDAIIAGNLTVQHVIGDGIWVEGSQPLLRRMADNVIGNNQAERTIRPVIIQQRSSGGSWRTLDGRRLRPDAGDAPGRRRDRRGRARHRPVLWLPRAAPRPVTCPRRSPVPCTTASRPASPSPGTSTTPI
jgi:hypothetical protein